jgi:hypothetical protein
MNNIKEETYVNKYGETIHMIETKNGDVYFKHDDFNKEFIKFDNLITILNWSKWNPKEEDEIKLRIILNLDEKQFVSNSLKDTKYEYLIPHINKQKRF